mmetsp:Transcript_3639/g.9812  ORF Transcript_3639/g.9812 Transcript_3639/m.9812 type:complete len:435 (+) Transcript_3639:692-1996(+)
MQPLQPSCWECTLMWLLRSSPAAIVVAPAAVTVTLPQRRHRLLLMCPQALCRRLRALVSICTSSSQALLPLVRGAPCSNRRARRAPCSSSSGRACIAVLAVHNAAGSWSFPWGVPCSRRASTAYLLLRAIRAATCMRGCSAAGCAPSEMAVSPRPLVLLLITPPGCLPWLCWKWSWQLSCAQALCILRCACLAWMPPPPRLACWWWARTALAWQQSCSSCSHAAKHRHGRELQHAVGSLFNSSHHRDACSNSNKQASWKLCSQSVGGSSWMTVMATAWKMHATVQMATHQAQGPHLISRCHQRLLVHKPCCMTLACGWSWRVQQKLQQQQRASAYPPPRQTPTSTNTTILSLLFSMPLDPQEVWASRLAAQTSRPNLHRAWHARARNRRLRCTAWPTTSPQQPTGWAGSTLHATCAPLSTHACVPGMPPPASPA